MINKNMLVLLTSISNVFTDFAPEEPVNAACLYIDNTAKLTMLNTDNIYRTQLIVRTRDSVKANAIAKLEAIENLITVFNTTVGDNVIISCVKNGEITFIDRTKNNNWVFELIFNVIYK
jgi:hypothetical protein